MDAAQASSNAALQTAAALEGQVQALLEARQNGATLEAQVQALLDARQNATTSWPPVSAVEAATPRTAVANGRLTSSQKGPPPTQDTTHTRTRRSQPEVKGAPVGRSAGSPMAVRGTFRGAAVAVQPERVWGRRASGDHLGQQPCGMARALSVVVEEPAEGALVDRVGNSTWAMAEQLVGGQGSLAYERSVWGSTEHKWPVACSATAGGEGTSIAPLSAATSRGVQAAAQGPAAAQPFLSGAGYSCFQDIAFCPS